MNDFSIFRNFFMRKLNIIAIFQFVFSLIAIYKIFFYLDHGFDFTDESFYLHWMSRPSLYKESVTQFGFIYHFLYRLLDGNIVWLRYANVILLLLLSFITSYFAININCEKKLSFIKKIYWPILLCVSFFFYFHFWLSTPSYNSLNYVGLLLAALSAILMIRESAVSSIILSLFFSTGLFLVIMAKPTSAIFLVLISIIFVYLSSYRFKMRLVSYTICLTVLFFLLATIFIDGSVLRFFDRMLLSIEDAKVLSPVLGVESLVKIDHFLCSDRVIYISVAMIFSFLVLFYFRHLSFVAAINFFITLTLSVLAIIILLLELPTEYFVYDPAYIYIFIVLNCIFLSISRGKSQICLSVYLTSLPFAYSFGTGNNFWSFAVGAGFFWIITTISSLKRLSYDSKDQSYTHLTFAFVQLFLSILLVRAWDMPYRQPEALKRSIGLIAIRGEDYSLVVAKDFESYIKLIRQTIHFEDPDPMLIDLTGHYPGVSYVLGAVAPGKPWLFGGYSGSYNFAKLTLSRLDCSDLAKSWLLIEEGGPIQIPVNILTNFGLNISSDYKMILKLPSPGGVFSQKYEHKFYKPIDIKKSYIKCLESKS